MSKTISVQCRAAMVLPFEKILPFQGDLKKISSENLRKLKQSIIKYGISSPMQVWIDSDGTYFTLDGHQRLLAFASLRKDGWLIPEIPVAIVEAEDKEQALEKLLIATSSYGEFSAAGVQKFISQLKSKENVQKVINLSNINLDRIFALLEEKSDPEIVPLQSLKAPITNTGDMWLMGDHRLICGDATKPEVVKILFGDNNPLMMITDPPYGVSYDATWRAEVDNCTNRKSGKVANDHLCDWSEAYKLFTGNVIYLWHAGVHALTVAQNLIDSGFKIRSEIIWVKQNLVLSRGHYHWMHEPAYYAVKEGCSADWTGDRKQTTVWQIPNSNPFAGRKDDQNTIHSTQKPLLCYELPIQNHGKAGDIIYDPFAGSGTLFIASERQSRVGYGCELMPEYCDIIVQRWCDYTGKEAIRASDGKKWSDLVKETFNGGLHENN
jgi:DNA modification methylase